MWRWAKRRTSLFVRAVASIGDFKANRLPSLEEAQRCFVDLVYQKKPWAARFTIYGAYGTESREPGAGRVDLWLTLSHDTKQGCFCIYHAIGRGPQYYSLGDETRLASDAELVEVDDNRGRVAS